MATKGPPPSRRRSHSVSSVSRKTHIPFDEKHLIITTEFRNSRDNPLFCATSSSLSSPPDKENGKTIETGLSNNKQFNSSGKISRSSSVVSAERGRSISRNGDAKNGIGRSLSRGRVHQDVVAPTGSRRNEVKQIGNSLTRASSVINRVDRHLNNGRLRKIQNQVTTEWSEDDSACSFQISILDDETSLGSVSEAEDKTINAFCENLNDFRRNGVETVTATKVTDIPPDLVNSGAVELISDIRRDYAIKLAQSEERAKKLREGLAIEEQRGQELDRVLKEILPDPKISSNVQRSRRGRRASNERKHMSKRLTEEALAYFDECVSLSTFDSSDFSAAEDQLLSSSGPTNYFGGSSLVKESPGSGSCCYGLDSNALDSNFHQKQLLYNCEESETNTVKTESNKQYQFSFANQQESQNCRLREDIITNSCIKNFVKPGIVKNDVKESYCTRSSYFDAGEYSMHGHSENMLIDSVLYKNRIDYGGLLLCSRAAISFLPFAW